jgi:hypothetical protein
MVNERKDVGMAMIGLLDDAECSLLTDTLKKVIVFEEALY